MRVPVVPPSEGDEARREGRQEVGVPWEYRRSAGTCLDEDRVEGSEASDHGTVQGKHDQCIENWEACPRDKNG